ncbi:sigma-70 family RNA polymerase sigma factor [Amycolatopsis sp. SID8362]|uniref:RNA polymerase sigma factor n=1 Tax=Amycolatopsis sp. SID8362 TaxID=2690346 RepID=UPI0013714838|nr:sigma-70 family RNA polymerase sigma factor [Amycolatopsis sp. SID8362]NBH06964.1 sigma-70 family RNA polymerase sigma factor [Amycolatopsis sp. SID8362]NED43661.1 sigma-70 family RNA polymerase sigma factor [Amycolatopsis sp. SID8362]
MTVTLLPAGRGYIRLVTSLPPDDELVAALGRGDDAAFAAVLDAWSASMLRLARSFVSTHASAEEVVQETWLAVLKGLGAFEGRSAFKTWVYRILVNTAKKRGLAERRSVPWTSLLPRDEDHGPTVDPARFQGAGGAYPGHWRETPAAWPSPEDTALNLEIRRVITTALDELPARQRAVLSLRDVGDHTAEEVCAMLRISAANQRVLLHRARAAVRERLAEYLGTGART